MERTESKNGRLKIDWDQLLPSQDDEPPPILVVEPSSDSLTQPRKPSEWTSDKPFSVSGDLERLNERDLRESLLRKKRTLEATAQKLPDKGEKLLSVIKLHEEELARRKMRRVEKEGDESEKPRPATSSSTAGEVLALIA